MSVTGLGKFPFKSSLVTAKSLETKIIFGQNQQAVTSAMTDFFLSNVPTPYQTKIFNGRTWVSKLITFKRWNGSSWVTATLKRWDGSSWVTIPSA
jgi:hypothetical protein